ncbi:hypothetical protein L3Q82_002540 [Scortum barcoo]|uniref:Uncharacterized protein n=1 Tax=Scortum barcoo TaxID=214431 RepID=A0ACB8VZ01_9TELE|nr:hypothetical protein L3Q82_002540 [Scortum barcoo]
MDRLVRRASSVLGCPLDSVEVVGNGRMMAKLSSLLNNTSHPLQDTLTPLGSSFSEQLLHPRCVKERLKTQDTPAPPNQRLTFWGSPDVLRATTASINKEAEKSKNEEQLGIRVLSNERSDLGLWSCHEIGVGFRTRVHQSVVDEHIIPLTEVITKSMCQPREVLVDIFQEYPEDTEHTYVPSCVVLNRCGGCCNDEAMECVPTETRNVTLQVMRFRPMVTQHTVQLRFTEHQKCDCRLKPDAREKKE